MNDDEEPQPSDDELSLSLLRVVDDREKADWLREVLSGFSHRCRNSLNGLKLGLYLTKRSSGGGLPAVWSDLETTYEAIERTIDRLQTIYRPMPLTLVESELGSMIAENEAAWRLCFTERRKILVIDRPPSDCAGRFDPMLLGQGLDALIDWRSQASPRGTVARLSWRCLGNRFRLGWNETVQPTKQPGLARPNASTLPRNRPRQPIDPLVLPLLARIIGAHSGHLEKDSGPTLSIQMTWPMTPECLARGQSVLHS
ncbi:MAG: hypothetical protein ABS79_06505 [Planctomycetes bacterium SCN 63-9]|nr:MAG: hypothetical protein ABS79_06505 [Planctomycetes bacterium SCN 63-9]